MSPDDSEPHTGKSKGEDFASALSSIWELWYPRQDLLSCSWETRRKFVSKWSAYWQEMNKGSDFVPCLEAAREDFELDPVIAFAAVFEDSMKRIEQYTLKRLQSEIKEATVLLRAMQEGTSMEACLREAHVCRLRAEDYLAPLRQPDITQYRSELLSRFVKFVATNHGRKRQLESLEGRNYNVAHNMYQLDNSRVEMVDEIVGSVVSNLFKMLLQSIPGYTPERGLYASQLNGTIGSDLLRAMGLDAHTDAGISLKVLRMAASHLSFQLGKCANNLERFVAEQQSQVSQATADAQGSYYVTEVIKGAKAYGEARALFKSLSNLQCPTSAIEPSASAEKSAVSSNESPFPTYETPIFGDESVTMKFGVYPTLFPSVEPESQAMRYTVDELCEKLQETETILQRSDKNIHFAKLAIVCEV